MRGAVSARILPDCAEPRRRHPRRRLGSSSAERDLSVYIRGVRLVTFLDVVRVLGAIDRLVTFLDCGCADTSAPRLVGKVRRGDAPNLPREDR